MAKMTSKNLRDNVIYSLFVRNFTDEGTFKAVIPELDRIKDLGVDIIWLLPIYPIGKIKRKGQEGSPYAIQDYRQVDPNYGTLEDFKLLVDEIHQREMKVMIDIVYNHTSPDSILVKEHPDWFYHRPDGTFGNRVGDWSDIIDLDYDQRELWDYQIDTLKYWAEIVDGFRCDVAPLIPLDFWLEARKQVEKVNPNLIWLAESVHPDFIVFLRNQGMVALSDSELYQAFDITYDYDIRTAFEDYLSGKVALSHYIDKIQQQEYIYPENYVKLRNLENHDNPRIANLVNQQEDLLQWLVMSYFLNGATLIYNGQEVQASKTPSLFDKDPIYWELQGDISTWMNKLNILKKSIIKSNTIMKLISFDEMDALVIELHEPTKTYYIGLNLKKSTGYLPLEIGKSKAINLLTEEEITRSEPGINLNQTPFIIETSK